MGRAFTEPLPGYRASTQSWVITRRVNPDDEFGEDRVLAADYDGGLRWVDVGASYDGSAIEFDHLHEAARFIAGMRFGRDSVSVEYYL